MDETLEYRFSADDVFLKLPEAIKKHTQFRIQRTDALSRRMELQFPLSWTSWGEVVTITVAPITDSSCEVRIKSRLNIYSVMGKQKQISHITDIFESLSKELAEIH